MAESGSAECLLCSVQGKAAKPQGRDAPPYLCADPKGETQRPWETVTPLAAWLGYKEGSSRFNVSYDVGGGEKDLVKSVLKHSGPVLICWEHDHIMPDIMEHIQKKYKITNYSSIPNPFPDVFYLVWVLDLKGSSYKWKSVNQNLMAGDV
jgi:hypothetical protein